jgi:hypothetical protein
MDRSRFRNTVIGPAATRTIVWTVVFLVGSLVALNVCLELRQPEIYDPEFDFRLSVLRERLREAPERPLLVVVGSSRITMGFRPESLPPLRTPDGACVLPFNLSHSGAGPLFELLMTTRLANEGIAPRWMVVELVPPMLGVDGESTAVSMAGAGDLPALQRHVSLWKLYGRYLYERSRVAVDHRDACIRAMAPWLTGPAVNDFPLYPLGGWSAAAPSPDPESAARRLDSVRAQYAPGLQRLNIRRTPDQALRDLLASCRKKSIGVVVVLTPESREFRSWYAPQTQKVVEAYCDALRRDPGVPVVDAREWLPDEAFIDGHHVSPDWADRFTIRLGRDVIEPLIAGRY